DVQEALGILERGTWSRQELENYARELDAKRVEYDVLSTAKKEAREKGLEEGREEGLEEGREEGREKGREERALEIAQDLLDVLDNATIARKTGLTVDRVEELRRLKN